MRETLFVSRYGCRYPVPAKVMPVCRLTMIRRSRCWRTTWQPQECIDAAKGLYDGKASGSVTCTQISPEAEANGCIVINAIEVCNADLQAAPFNPLPGVVDPIPALCERVQVDAQYDFFKGEYCFTAADGTQECVDIGRWGKGYLHRVRG